ncbi:MAG: hypothetical protein ACK4WD_09125 [Flavobacteriales bacterium]|jgi:uncharacterized protein
MSRSTGLLGIDIAYLVALIGTMFSTAFFILGQRLNMLSHEHFYLFFDFFPALFFFLNGLTVTLTMRDRRISSRRLLSYLSKRGSVLFLIGLVFVQVWPMNVFIASGAFYMVAPIFSQWNNIILRSLAVTAALGSIVFLNLDVHTSVIYQRLNLSGAGFSDFFGFIFFNGYYSVLPWFTFFIAGMLFGRSSLRPRGYFPPINVAMIFCILLSFIVEKFCTDLYGVKDALNSISTPILGKKLYLPANFIFQIATIVLIVNLLLHAFRGEQPRNRVKFLQEFSSSKYSIFFFHLFFSFLLLIISTGFFFSKKTVLLTSCFFLIFISLFTVYIWKKKLSSNAPIEWIIKRISGSTKK